MWERENKRLRKILGEIPQNAAGNNSPRFDMRIWKTLEPSQISEEGRWFVFDQIRSFAANGVVTVPTPKDLARPYFLQPYSLAEFKGFTSLLTNSPNGGLYGPEGKAIERVLFLEIANPLSEFSATETEGIIMGLLYWVARLVNWEESFVKYHGEKP